MTSVIRTGSVSMKGWRLAIVVGLLVAVGAGIAAGSFKSLAAQTVLYAMSSVGWVTATSILAFKHALRSEAIVAAGFLILTVAETLLWVNGYPDSATYEAGFAGGVMFYVPGLLLAAAPTVYPRVIRLLALLAAGAWTMGTARFLLGSEFAHADPLAIAGYVLISSFFLGVAWATLRDRLDPIGPNAAISATPKPAHTGPHLRG
jgi:hypothetical protein